MQEICFQTRFKYAMETTLKDQIGDREGECEWEPIKIPLKNSAYAPNHFRRVSHTIAKIT
jgi:hypothetical protein